LKPLYFVSDLHLGTSGDEERRARFFRFLGQIRDRASGLFILGDLFEFGFEYRQGLTRPNVEIAAEIAKLVTAGLEVTLIKGNHDCWLSPGLEYEYGIEVVDSPCVVELGGRKLYLAHGDEFDRSLKNQLSRRLFHSRVATWFYSWLPEKSGAALANWISDAGRQPGGNPILAERLERVAAERLQSGFDIVAMAHIHRPELKPMGAGWYLNTGDWMTHFSYGVLDDAGLRLESYRDRITERVES
jgi:UDP-2,3-diacylglucosamine hydrolase